MAKKKKIESNESFDNMADAMNTKFDGEEDLEETVTKQIGMVSKLKTEITTSDLTKYELEDAKFMEEQIKKNLEGLESVSNRLEQEIKVGSKASMFEVYATLANSKLNAVKELRELRKIIVDLKISLEKPKEKTPTKVTNNFITNEQLAKMISKASEKNSMKEIDATFKVDEE